MGSTTNNNMAQGYTLQELQSMQSKQVQSSGLSLEQLQAKQTQATPQPQSLSDKIWGSMAATGNAVGGFLGGKQVGEAIGTLGGYGLTAAQEKLGLAPKGATAAYDLSAPTPLQVTGDVARSAASVAGFKGVGIAGTLVQRVLSNIGLGVTIGGGSAIAEGKSGKEVLKSAATVGAIAGAI